MSHALAFKINFIFSLTVKNETHMEIMRLMERVRWNFRHDHLITPFFIFERNFEFIIIHDENSTQLNFTHINFHKVKKKLSFIKWKKISEKIHFMMCKLIKRRMKRWKKWAREIRRFSFSCCHNKVEKLSWSGNYKKFINANDRCFLMRSLAISKMNLAN